MREHSNAHEEHKHEEHKHDEPKKAHAEEDVSFDFSKIKRLFSVSSIKKNSVLLLFLLVLIPVVLTVYIRVQPQYLHVTESWAANSVNNYYRSQIAQQINSQYPNLPQANKDTLINQQLDAFLKSNTDNIQQQIKSTGAYFKSGFQYQENNVTYTFLGDLDSYFFLRYARNLLNKGMYCDEIRDGQCWDNHMFAPVGIQTTPSMHPYGMFYLYKFLHLINPTINLMQAAFLLPTFLAVLAAIAAFFVGRRIMNTTGGFFAAMFLALSPMFLSRTLGSDTDIWNIMFPIIILWVFLEAFEAKSFVKKSILAAVAGLLNGISSFAWGGWWYIFDIIIASLIIYLVFTFAKNYFKHKSFKKVIGEELRPAVIILVILIISSLVFVSLFTSFGTFKLALSDPITRSTVAKEAAHADYWPNIQTTVAEMNEAGIDTIISQAAFGKNIFFGLALLGIIFTLVSKKPSLKEYFIILGSAFLYLIMVSKAGLSLATRSIYLYLFVLMIPVAIAVLILLFEKRDSGAKDSGESEGVDIKPALLLLIWFVGMIFAGTKGVRFILLLIPAFAVAIGVAIGYIYQYLSSMISKEFKITPLITKIAIFILLCLILIMPLRAGIATGESFVPSMTKGWWDSLTQIRVESSPDAIINSWWDFGHWFKYVADRRVTVDGSGQDYQLAHWMGTILVTDDEHQAINTIRMLDCGSRETYITLLNATNNDVLLAVNLTKTIIMQSKSDARKTLEKAGVSSEAIEATLNYSFCTPPEHFLITSGDMIGKAGVWAHFGYWDFNKAYMIREVRPKDPDEGIKLLTEKFGYTEDQASIIYYELQSLDSDRAMNDWISPWPNYLIGNWIGCQKVNATQQTGNDTNSTNATKVKEFLACPINSVISDTTNGKTVLELAAIDLEDYYNSSLVLGAYDTTGYKRGAGSAIPSEFVLFFNDTIKTVKMENVTFPYAVLIDMVNNQLLITDPLLSESLFTKLFYFDGRYTTHFEKFSDTSDITGSRIIVWKVKWDSGE